MSLFLLMTGSAFYIPEGNGRLAVVTVALGIYLFAMAYSPGEGPVPLTVSAPRLLFLDRCSHMYT